MEQINAYIPESVFYDGKTESLGRTLHEDSAIVFAKDNFRIISARGKLMRENESLCTLFDRADTPRNALTKAIASKKTPVSVATKSGTLLLFTQPYGATGLILAVHVNAKEEEVRAILDSAYTLGEFPVLCEKNTNNPSLERIIDEILYYTNRIFRKSSTQDLWTTCRLIANFAGCHLTYSKTSMRQLTLSDAERMRLIAFLLAAFLGMHKFIGSTTADAYETVQTKESAEKAQPTAAIGIPTLNVSLSQRPAAQQYLKPRHRAKLDREQELLIDRLLSLPAFTHFCADQKDGALILEANFQTEERLLANAPARFKQIVITLSDLPFLSLLVNLQKESYVFE